MSQPRRIAASDVPFVEGRTVEEIPITALEGRATDGLAVKPLVAGDGMVLLRITRRKGLVDPEHVHPDHESICYLESGRMRVVIGEREFLAGPGDSWVHAAGVPHWHETLEDSVQLEIKSPPTRTWG